MFRCRRNKYLRSWILSNESEDLCTLGSLLAPFFPYHAGMDQWIWSIALRNMTERSKSFFYSLPIIWDTTESVSKDQDNLYLLLPHCRVGNHSKTIQAQFSLQSFIDCCIMFSDGPRELILTPQMNWEHPFWCLPVRWRFHLQRLWWWICFSAEEMNLNPYVFISHILIMLDLVQWCTLLGWPLMLVCLGQSWFMPAVSA